MPSNHSASRYLSKIPLNNRLGVYAAHQKIMECLAGRNHPLWRRCSRYAIILADTPLNGCESRQYLPNPKSGQVVPFNLLAEITVSKKNEKSKQSDRGRRIDPIMLQRIHNPKKSYQSIAREVGSEWLDRQGVKGGYEVTRLDRVDYDVLEFMRKRKNIRIGTTHFLGKIKITEPEKFKQLMLNGIGHGKAWGCGLMLCLRN